jgi:ATP-dependent helicase HrpA
MQGVDAVHLREHLFNYLAFALRGEQITEKDFSFERIDQYLVPFIKVIDEKGKLIAQGRDLDELKARCRVETHRPVKQQQGEFQAFPENFIFEASQKVTGVIVKQYQALVPTKFLHLKQKMNQVWLFKRLMISMKPLNSIVKV